MEIKSREREEGGHLNVYSSKNNNKFLLLYAENASTLCEGIGILPKY